MDERLLELGVRALRLLTLLLLGCRTQTAVVPEAPIVERGEAEPRGRVDVVTPSVPVIDADPLVIASEYRHWPTFDEGYPRFVLFADGHAVWRERDGDRWRWFVTQLDDARTAELHGAIEAATRGLAPYMPCTEPDPHNDRTELFVRVGDRIRAHRIEAPQRCPAEQEQAFTNALARIDGFDPPRRTAWHPSEQARFPGEARIVAAFDAEVTDRQVEMETACRDSARALLACTKQVKHPDRAEQLCTELAEHAIADSSCLMVTILDDVCHSSYERGCPMLVQ
jgi:hypothetical protein